MVKKGSGGPAMGDHPAGMILIVTGSTLRAEQMDRPLAYYLHSEIDKLAAAAQQGVDREERLALVLSDRFYLSHPDLHALPLISVGGPGVNRLAQKLLKQLPAALAVECKYFIQMDPSGQDRRVSIWGMNNPQTQLAVLTFAQRYLPCFVQKCWQRPS
jgi:hypothetical protein